MGNTVKCRGRVLGRILLLAATVAMFLIPSGLLAADTFVYVGNFASKPTDWSSPPTEGRGFGIYKYDAKTGALKLIKTGVMGNVAVGATSVDAKRNVLYCNDERMTHKPENGDNGRGGLIYAMKIDPKTGELTELNHQPSYATLPSYTAVDAEGKYLIATNYTNDTPVTRMVKDGSGKYSIGEDYGDVPTVLYKLNSDGSIGDVVDAYLHSGSGPDKGQQSHPRVHSVMMSPSGNLFAACDKGSDLVYFFRINKKTEKLELADGQPYKTFAGSMPRYSVFHPTKPFFYMNHERNKLAVSAFSYTEDGKLEFIQAVDVLPEGVEADKKMKQSDIRIHPSGRYIYSLVRGLDAVSVFAVDDKTGKLELIQSQKLEKGSSPRGCNVSPDGKFFYVAETSLKKVAVLAIGKDGKLSPTEMSYDQPSPGNVTFFTAR